MLTHGRADRLGFRDLHHLPAHVMTASRADDMGGNRRAALRAKRQLAGFLGIMRTSFSSSRIRMFAFGNGHLATSKQAATSMHTTCFTDNLFGSNDKLLILEIAPRDCQAEREMGARSSGVDGAFSMPASVCSPERSAHWTMGIHPPRQTREVAPLAFDPVPRDATKCSEQAVSAGLESADAGRP